MTQTYVFTGNRLAEIHGYIDKLFKRKEETAFQRNENADRLIESYFQTFGEVPPPSALERLGSYIMREDYEDQRKNKVQLTEYPALSERQMARRYENEATFAEVEYVSDSSFGTKKTNGESEGDDPSRTAIHPATIPNTTKPYAY